MGASITTTDLEEKQEEDKDLLAFEIAGIEEDDYNVLICMRCY